jgi:prepilin-type N-terminal cleavage/methylation domain-containing protein
MKSSFTLIELMIVVVIIAIIIMMAREAIAGKQGINKRSQTIASQLTYFEDEKTHLCFVRQYDKVIGSVDCEAARKQIRDYDRQEQHEN